MESLTNSVPGLSEVEVTHCSAHHKNDCLETLLAVQKFNPNLAITAGTEQPADWNVHGWGEAC